jgi:hypothetical protein
MQYRLNDQMALSAIQLVVVDFIAPLKDIASEICGLISEDHGSVLPNRR